MTHRPFVRWKALPPEERARRTVVTCVVQLWNQQGKLPTVARISSYKKMKEDDVRAALDNETTVADLIQLGVLRDDVTSWQQAVAGQDAGLTARQIKAVDAYYARVHSEEKQTIGQALGTIGVSAAEWNGWMKDPVFHAYVTDLGAQLFGDHQGDIDIALIREATSGDVPAIKLAMEVTGRIKQDKNSIDAGMLLARVLEAIERHCDPATQAALAAELASVAVALRSRQTAPPKIIDQVGRVLA